VYTCDIRPEGLVVVSTATTTPGEMRERLRAQYRREFEAKR
jgi:hypothetical protein